MKNMSIKDIKPKSINLKKATIYILLASFCLSLMALFVKLASKKTNNSIIIFFRFSISFLYILLIIFFKKLKNKNLHLKTKNIKLHIIRAVFSMLAMYLLYYSLRFIPILEANLLIMTNALFIPIIGFLFFQYKLSKKHLLAVIIGFTGVFFILRPSNMIFQFKALYALLSGFTASISFIYIRKISKVDHHHTSMFYYFLFAFVASLVLVLFNFEVLDFKTVMLLIAASIFGTLYQEFLIRASVYATAKFNSSMLYSSLIFSTIFGILFFKNIPTLITILGIILVVVGSILTIFYSKKEIV
jgi:drug/metabolite transporter (DMT)-like permease